MIEVTERTDNSLFFTIVKILNTIDTTELINNNINQIIVIPFKIDACLLAQTQCVKALNYQHQFLIAQKALITLLVVHQVFQ